MEVGRRSLYGVAETIPLTAIFRGILPFFHADLLRIVIIVVLPIITPWLPGVVG